MYYYSQVQYYMSTHALLLVILSAFLHAISEPDRKKQVNSKLSFISLVFSSISYYVPAFCHQ